jgi:hypothetical protein
MPLGTDDIRVLCIALDEFTDVSQWHFVLLLQSKLTILWSIKTSWKTGQEFYF